MTDRPPAVSYASCGQITNLGSATVTVSLESSVLDAGGTAYPAVALFTQEYTLGPSGGRFGCGLNILYDYDFSHPVARTYRLRVRQVDGPTMVEGTAAMGTFIQQLPSRVVINEFRVRGPNGVTDQFVELFNQSTTPYSYGSRLCGGPPLSNGDCVTFETLTIGGLCHYLITAPGYSGSVRGDASMRPFLPDSGWVVFSPPQAVDGMQSDLVGMNYFNAEGTALPPFGPGDTDRSYVRIGTDSNNNANDFVMRSPSSPQNSASCGTR